MRSNDQPEIPSANYATAPDATAVAVVLDDLDGTPPPRLGIFHFVAWLTVAAVLLGIDSTLWAYEEGFLHRDRPSIFDRAVHVIDLVSMSAGIVGFATFIRWRTRAKPMRLSPGHWILPIEVVSIVLMYLVETTGRILDAIPGGTELQFGGLLPVTLDATIALVQTVAYVWTGIRSRAHVGWLAIFVNVPLNYWFFKICCSNVRSKRRRFFSSDLSA